MNIALFLTGKDIKLYWRWLPSIKKSSWKLKDKYGEPDGKVWYLYFYWLNFGMQFDNEKGSRDKVN